MISLNAGMERPSVVFLQLPEKLAPRLRRTMRKMSERATVMFRLGNLSAKPAACTAGFARKSAACASFLDSVSDSDIQATTEPVAWEVMLYRMAEG